MKIFLQITVAVLLFVSCAERRYGDSIGDDKAASLDAWIELNRAALEAEALSFEEIEVVLDENTGKTATMYCQWLRKAGKGAESPNPEESHWTHIDYTAYVLAGYEINHRTGQHKANAFSTRNKDLAHTLGTFNNYCHYTSLYIISNDNGGLYDGQYAMLMRMKVGDSVRVFIPASLSGNGNTIFSQHGYGGNASAPVNQPMVITMSMIDVVRAPSVTELNAVREFARTKMGVTMTAANEKDSLFIKEVYNGSKDIPADSSANLYYKAYFLENGKRGFLFGSNIDSVNRRMNRDTTGYYPLLWPKGSGPVAAFGDILDVDTLKGKYKIDLRYDAELTMVTSSDFAYGSNGQTGGDKAAYVRPYTPLIFDIYVREQKTEE